MDRSDYPREILEQIAAKQEREKKIKEEQALIDKQSIAAQLKKEHNEAMYEKIKRQKEKEVMSSILKHQMQLNSNKKKN